MAPIAARTHRPSPSQHPHSHPAPHPHSAPAPAPAPHPARPSARPAAAGPHVGAAATVVAAPPLATPAPPLPARVAGVEVVRWPEQAHRRAQLDARGEPCLLVVDADAPAPATTLVEDWVRAPVDLEELAVRGAAARRRAGCGEVPTLDDGLLLHRGAWAAVPPGQVAMVELLLTRIGRPVRKEELSEAAEAAGASGHHDAVKAGMNRLARRVAPLGLELRGVRGTGWVLQVADGCPLHAPVSAANAKG